MTRQDFASLKVGQWPEIDRTLWQASRKPVGPLDDGGIAVGWSATTLHNCERGYGVWLGWLASIGAIDPEIPPCDRVTQERVAAFLDAYRVGRAECTVAGTLRDIAYALRACAPPDGLIWLTKLAHRMVNRATPSRPKLPRMARTDDIIALGSMLMNDGLAVIASGRRSGALLYRDGLIISFLIRRPMRLRNLASLQLGKNVYLDDYGARIDIPTRDTKKGVPIDIAWPASLMDDLRIYLDLVRPLLQGKGAGADEGWLWISHSGRRLPDNNITARVTGHTAKHLRRALSPHLFRDCAATEIALQRPELIGITKDILGHAMLASSQKYYNQASSLTAFARHHDVIRLLRERGTECH